MSHEYGADIAACRGDLDELVRRLNEEFAEAAEREIRTGDWKTARTRNKTSPSHYKLETYGIEGLLDGVAQVIGHTPPEKLARGYDVVTSVALAPQEVDGAALASRSLYLVDPSVQWSLPEPAGSPALRCDGVPPPGRYRYAVVSGGRITVHESGRVGGG